MTDQDPAVRWEVDGPHCFKCGAEPAHLTVRQTHLWRSEFNCFAGITRTLHCASCGVQRGVGSRDGEQFLCCDYHPDDRLGAGWRVDA